MDQKLSTLENYSKGILKEKWELIPMLWPDDRVFKVKETTHVKTDKK